MIYQATIPITANTSKGSATRTVLRVSKGLVWYIGIHYPPGCMGLAHAQIFDGKYQLFPSSPGESIASDGAVVGFDDLYYKQAAPFSFDVVTWNVDETHAHTLTVRVGIATNPAFMSRYLPGVDISQFDTELQRIKKAQEEEKQAQFEVLTKQITGG